MTIEQSEIVPRILRDINDGVLVVDMGGRIIYMNDPGCDMLGVDQSVFGKNYSRVFLENETDAVNDGFHLEDSSLGGVNGGIFVRRAEYICQESACLSCGKCMEGCPTKAIFLHRSCPVIDPCLCIDCGWCEEHCPTGAILRTIQLTPV